MTNHFDNAAKEVLEAEGVFSDRAVDRGGKTKFGIIERVARANGYNGAMQDLTVEFALSIYRSQYWDTLRLDEIAEFSYPIARELFDTGVNMGIGVSARFLQRVLNVMNRGDRLYADMVVDGVMGPVTVEALRSYLATRSEAVLLRALNALQGSRYIEIAEGDESQEHNVYGWFMGRVA